MEKLKKQDSWSFGWFAFNRTCSMTGVRRVESGWTRWSAKADEDSDGWVDTQQGWTDAAAQPTDAGEHGAAASDTRPWSQLWYALQEQVTSTTEAGVDAGETRRRNESKQFLSSSYIHITPLLISLPRSKLAVGEKWAIVSEVNDFLMY